MKVALYKPAIRPIYRGSYSLSLACIKAYLQQHCPDVEVVICEESDHLLPQQPDLIGIAAAASESWEITKVLVEDLRKQFDGLIILGGQHITAVPETLPPSADLAVLGEGEETMREIVETLRQRGRAGLKEINGLAYRENGRLVVTPPRPPLDMDTLPEPADAPRKFISRNHLYCLSTTRGCPYHCSHCVEWGFHHKVRLMSAERIFELMMKHYEETGDGNVRFLDDLVTANLRRILRLRDLMKERGVLGKFTLGSVSACAHHVTDDMVQALAEMNACEIGIGMESCSPRVLKLYKGDAVTLEDIAHAIETCTKYGMPLGGVNLLGYPGETLEEMRETVRFVQEHSKGTTFKLWGNGYYVCQPLPGSKLWREGLAAGKLSVEMDFSRLRIAPWDEYDLRIFDSAWYYGNEETVSRERFIQFIREQGYQVFDQPDLYASLGPPPLSRLPITTEQRAAMYERLAQRLEKELTAQTQRNRAGEEQTRQLYQTLAEVKQELKAHAEALQGLRAIPGVRVASKLSRLFKH